MPGPSATFLIGLGAMGFAVAALCLDGYDISTARERLRQRIDLINLSRQIDNRRARPDRRQVKPDRR